MNSLLAWLSNPVKSPQNNASKEILETLPFNTLTAVSPVDGRYQKTTAPLAHFLSEYALIKHRVYVECEYFISLSTTKGVGMRQLTNDEMKTVRTLYAEFSVAEAELVSRIEKEGIEGIPATRHDVKAVEYFLKMKLKGTTLEKDLEWIHFALTSEDVNSLAYALMLRGTLEHSILVTQKIIVSAIESHAKNNMHTAMLARTHGQPASPTTFGKELRVFTSRLDRQITQLSKNPILVKFAGATGNWNAHMIACPTVDWRAFSAEFIASFNAGHDVLLEHNPLTTQIEPHDTYAELCDSLKRINTILIDFSQDMWRYISDGWVVQKAVAGEIGSSAMPHKVNPIDFENAEGNLGVANALFEHLSRKLPVSRLQRDLTDSTTLRTFGTAFAHALIAYQSLMRGLGKVQVSAPALQSALDEHPEVIAEAIQTVLRVQGVAVPYEKLKELTRGKKITMDDFRTFITHLEVAPAIKEKLLAIRPDTYTGIAGR